MNITVKIITTLLCCFFLTGVSGCGSSKPSSFYLLTSLPEAVLTDVQPTTRLSLSIGPVRLPGYLDRKQLIARSEKNELAVREYNRWGEPLQDNFQRVLIVNLSVLLATPQVYEYGSRDIKEADFQLIVDVPRFDVSDDGQAILIAFWSINDSRGKQLQRNKSTLQTKSQSLEAGDIVKALNLLLTDFSTEVADVIHSMK